MRGKKTGQTTWNKRLYKVWNNMRDRCRIPTHTHYKWYGAKGITICLEWDEYLNFYNWALNNGYQDNLTIDRINPKGNYCPENCQWISGSDNIRKANKDNNKEVLLTYNGQTMSYTQWSRHLGFSRGVIRQRIILNGWTIEKALTTPLLKVRIPKSEKMS